MSKTTQFDDLGKDGKDLATRGFPAPGSLKVNYETKTPFGFVLKSNGLHDKKKGFSVGTENEYKWSIGDNAAILKSKWDNKHVGEGSLAVSDLLTKGTEVRPWFKRELDGTQHSLTGGVLVGFANESTNVQLKTTSASDFTKHVADVNVVIQAPKNVFWGANVRATHVPAKPLPPKSDDDKDTKVVEPEKSTTAYDYNLKFHYVQEGSGITIAYETDPKLKQKTGGVTFFQTPSSDLKVATEFKVLPAPVVNVTTDHKWDATTSVKTKLSVGENARLGVAYSQKVGTFATAAFGADLNVTKLLGGSASDDHGFGFELSLK